MRAPRMQKWSEWRQFIYPMLGKMSSTQLYSISQIQSAETYRAVIEPIFVPKIRRDLSFTSLHSGMSMEELQKQYDMMHASDKPLAAEDAATIISGSLSLMDGDDPEEDRLESLVERGDDSSINDAYLQKLTEKKRQLQRNLDKVNLSYQLAKEKAGRKMAMEADTSDVEGLQLFRPSYQAWRSQTIPKIIR